MAQTGRPTLAARPQRAPLCLLVAVQRRASSMRFPRIHGVIVHPLHITRPHSARAPGRPAPRAAGPPHALAPPRARPAATAGEGALDLAVEGVVAVARRPRRPALAVAPGGALPCARAPAL